VDTTNLPVNTRRYGSPFNLPETLELRAGPVTLTLENADLRGVKFGDIEIVQRLYVAIRDQNWGTIQPEYSRFTVHNRGDSFEITFQAVNKSADVDFAWSGSIFGDDKGTITYRMDGAPRKSFLRNRIGFCVLHPMTVAGLPATVTTPDATIDGHFPEQISPNQPFIDMTWISHPAGETGRVTITFEGDLFEVEDQRNWTDASYKTYSTPLRIPYPVEVTPDDRITQIVTISVSGEPEMSPGAASPDVTIDFDQQVALPTIGFGSGRKPITNPETIARLADLKPAHILAEIDLGGEAERWQRRLTNAAANAEATGAALDVSAVAGPDQECWSLLRNWLAEHEIAVRNLYVFPAPDDPVVFPRFDLVTNEPTAAAASAQFADTDTSICGGTRAYFTELNRGIDLIPLDVLRDIMFTITPEVHAVDNRSVMENIAAQAVAVASARELIGDRPLTVGPITLKPPYNPNATSAPPKAGPDRLPDEVDVRQLSLFAAGWTVGSLRHLIAAGVDAATYFELEGWRGLIEKTDDLTRRELFPSTEGGLFPVWHVFNAVASFGPAQAASVESADVIGQEAVALVAGNRVRMLVANLTNADREITVACGDLENGSVRYLDEATWQDAIREAGLLTGEGEPIATTDGMFRLGLAPYGVAVVDGERLDATNPGD
jgi:hypothetical protein